MNLSLCSMIEPCTFVPEQIGLESEILQGRLGQTRSGTMRRVTLPPELTSKLASRGSRSEKGGRGFTSRDLAFGQRPHTRRLIAGPVAVMLRLRCLTPRIVPVPPDGGLEQSGSFGVLGG